MIENMHDLQKLVQQDQVDWRQYGDVRAVYNGDLVLFNYTREAEFENRWNWFERNSRGLILNHKTGEVVAWPLKKFWNWLQGGHVAHGHIVNITEKIDGSCGIVYRYAGTHIVATRGSFESEQALWATNWLHRNVDLSDCPEAYTLICEIVYPENRIVVDYDHSGLYLLAIRNRFTGEMLPFYPDVYEFWTRHQQFYLPKVYNFNSVTDIIAATDTLSANYEGWVVEFSDGQRFKFKGDRYLDLHKIVTNITYERIVKHMQNGTIGRILQDTPDEFLHEIRIWVEDIESRTKSFELAIEALFDIAPKDTRKKFAVWVMKECPVLSNYLFARLDGRDYRNMILRKEF